MPSKNRAEVLDLANKAVNGDRNAQYGEPYDDFSRTAAMMNSYYGMPDFFKPHDVAVIQTMVKLSRIRQTPDKQDSWVDIAGYAACGFDTTAAAPKQEPVLEQMFVRASA